MIIVMQILMYVIRQSDSYDYQAHTSDQNLFYNAKKYSFVFRNEFGILNVKKSAMFVSGALLKLYYYGVRKKTQKLAMKMVNRRVPQGSILERCCMLITLPSNCGVV